ncbi:RlpA-like double-psi beta-barrel-protein domain-containing protein-containing protein [Trametes maxima]|nr:RlpA-like double-psi beta-barrel-protein domain-containing protein-containing protein [Trametes maxima]
MFDSSRSFVLTILSLALAAVVLLAGSAHAAPFRSVHAVAHSHNTQDRPSAQNGTQPASGPVKRYDGARFTYYDAGQNACGSVDSDSAYIIALSPALYNNGEHCFKQVTVQYNGKQVQATVTDECPGCSDSQADLSRPLFAALAPLDQGVIYGQWWFD